MELREIGCMIYKIRTEKEIHQEELCRGVCSVPTLSRLETGERRPDILIFNTLLQRLGVDSNIIDIVLSLEEFEYFIKRRNVEISLSTEEYERAERELEELERDEEGGLRRQDIYRLYGALYLSWGKEKEAEEYLHKAILETVPEFDGIVSQGRKRHFMKLWLSEVETALFLLYAFVKEEAERERLLLLLKVYIEQKITDEKVYNRQIAQVMYLLAEVKKQSGQWQECFQYCEGVIAAEAENGILFLLPHALRMEAFCLEQGIWAQNQELRKRQYKALEETLEEHGAGITERNPVLFMKGASQEKYLIDELIRKSRERKGLSQEELSEGICTPETLSRIETGKRNPTVKNFHALMKKLELGFGYYNLEIEAERFETLEMERELQKRIIFWDFKEAGRLLNIIEKEIDNRKLKNRQYLEYYHALIDWRLGKIDDREVMSRLETTLGLTLEKEEDGFQIPKQLTLIEIYILNSISNVWGKMGGRKKSVKILESIYEYFKESRVKDKLGALEYGKKYLMILGNLASYKEETDDLEKAMEYIVEALEESIKNNIGVRIGKFLLTKGCIQERMGEMKCVQTYKKVYYISGLYKDFESQSIADKLLKESFDCEL